MSYLKPLISTLDEIWYQKLEPISSSVFVALLARFCVVVAVLGIYSSFMNWATLVGVMPFAERGAKGLLYGVLALALLLLAVRRQSGALLPFAIFFSVLLLATLLHEFAYAVKGMVIGIALFLCVGGVVVSYKLQVFTARLMMFVTLFFVAGLMFEVWYPGSFSTTLGRSALMYMNPNLAAAGLCLGAFSGLPAVSREYKLSYLILVSTGVLCTLSRSASLGLFLAGLLWIVANRSWLFKLTPVMVKAYAVAALVLISCGLFLTQAYNKVEVFEWATQTAVNGVPPRQPKAPVQVPSFIPQAEGAHGGGNVDVYGITAAEEKSSAGARKQLLIRAWDEYWQSPVVGKGLNHAFSLAPHNSFILFAVAVGALGWFVVPVWLYLIARFGRAVELKMTAMFLLVSALFMHDLFTNHALMMAMLLAIVVNSRLGVIGGKQ